MSHTGPHDPTETPLDAVPAGLFNLARCLLSHRPMAWSPLDTRWWHLSVGAMATTAAAACGPTITLDDTGNDSVTDSDGDTDGPPDTDTDAPTTSAPPQCVNNSDCTDPGDICIDNMCVPDEPYCSDYGCCYDGCCDGGCYYYECYGHQDCGTGSLCHDNYGGGYCEGVPELPACDSAPIMVLLPVEETGDDPVFSLSMVETNGDEIGDVAVAHNSGSITLYAGGGVAAPQTIQAPADGPPPAIASGDFNGDGIADLAGTAPGGRLWVMAGDGVGFAALSEHETSLTDQLLPLDFNGDGNLDLTGRGLEGVAVVMLGDGAGNFPTTELLLPADSLDDLGVGSVDAGPPSDIFTQFGMNTRLHMGNEVGDYEPAWEAWSLNYDTLMRLYVGDIDGDGSSDVGRHTVINDNWTLLETYLNVLGTSNEARSAILRTTRFGGSGDVTGDGQADVVMLADTDAVFAVAREGGGSTPFACQYTAQIGFGPTMTVVGDFDGDGAADVVVANQEQVAVLASP